MADLRLPWGHLCITIGLYSQGIEVIKLISRLKNELW